MLLTARLEPSAGEFEHGDKDISVDWVDVGVIIDDGFGIAIGSVQQDGAAAEGLFENEGCKASASEWNLHDTLLRRPKESSMAAR